jgi:hypothetical protein
MSRTYIGVFCVTHSVHLWNVRVVGLGTNVGNKQTSCEKGFKEFAVDSVNFRQKEETLNSTCLRRYQFIMRSF